MPTSPLTRLKLLSHLALPPAAAVPDALQLIEEAVPGIGSLLLWCSQSGAVAGGYSSLIGMEEGLAHYVEQFANSQHEAQVGGTSFRDDMANKTTAEVFSDVLQMDLTTFRQTDVYRTMMAPYGIADLARVVTSHRGAALGALVVFRGEGAPAFKRGELNWLTAAAPILGALLAQQRRLKVPLIQMDEPSTSTVDYQAELLASTASFRQHLVMLNQNAPGESPTRFAAELPQSLKHHIQSDAVTSSQLTISNAWGLFQVFLQPVQERQQTALIVQRLVPVTLKMFRVLQGFELSERQLQTACGLAAGASFSDLATQWGISRHSIITHAGNLYDKLGVENKSDLLNTYLWGCPTPLPSAI